MSNALAIASVTRLLRDLLNDAVVNGDIAAQLGTDVLVTSRPPDRIIEDIGDTQPTQLNVYLHRVTPNAHPTRRLSTPICRPVMGVECW